MNALPTVEGLIGKMILELATKAEIDEPLAGGVLDFGRKIPHYQHIAARAVAQQTEHVLVVQSLTGGKQQSK